MRVRREDDERGAMGSVRLPLLTGSTWALRFCSVVAEAEAIRAPWQTTAARAGGDYFRISSARSPMATLSVLGLVGPTELGSALLAE